jgi:DNA topoisomerase VI subunit A
MSISAIILLLQGEPYGWRSFIIVGIGCIILVVLLNELATRALKRGGHKKRGRRKRG